MPAQPNDESPDNEPRIIADPVPEPAARNPLARVRDLRPEKDPIGARKGSATKKKPRA